MPQRVLIVGSGNLAWHLDPNLQRIGLEVDIWSRNPAIDDHLDWRSSKAGFPKAGWNAIDYAAIFLAVPDDYISAVSQQLSQLFNEHTPIVHTSGATAITAINSYFKNRAALWPIRSLRKGEEVADWTDLPLVYYANNTLFEQQLSEWVNQLSELTYRLDDEQRAQLHLAAVFSNNLTTWLCQIAYELCQDRQIPFEALVPIIKNTFSKIDHSEPATRQTGAAIRGDQKTMNRHLSLLGNHPEYAKLYKDISDLIGAYRDKQTNNK